MTLFTENYKSMQVKFTYDQVGKYDPATGQFSSQDPIRHQTGDPNLYRYVGNAPGDGIDSKGLEGPWRNYPYAPKNKKGPFENLSALLVFIAKTGKGKKEADRIGKAILNTFEMNWRLKLGSKIIHLIKDDYYTRLIKKLFFYPEKGRIISFVFSLHARSAP